MSGFSCLINGRKSSLRCTARMPFTFQETMRIGILYIEFDTWSANQLLLLYFSMIFNEAPRTPKVSFERSFNKESSGYVGPTLIVYRQNEFLDANVGKLQHAIETEGGEIQVHAFPSSTSEQTIRDWYRDNADLLTSKRLLTDMTCSYRGTGPIESTAQLDAMITAALWNTAAAQKVGSTFEALDKPYGTFESLDTTEKYDSAITALVGVILNNLDSSRRPEKIYLVKDRIADHYPIPVEEGGAPTDGRPEISEELLSTVAERTKAALANAGIAKDKVIVVNSTSDLLTTFESERRLITAQNDWILIDRHVLKSAIRSENPDDKEFMYIQESSVGTIEFASLDEFKAASADGMVGVILRLPLGDLMSDAKEFKLLSFSTAGIETELLKESVKLRE